MFKKSSYSSLPLLVAAGWLVAGTVTAQTAAPSSAAPATPAAKPAELFPDTVVAKGKGFEIKRSQLDDEVIRIKSQFLARGTPLPADRAAMLERQVLDQLIQLQIVKTKATVEDRAAAQKQADKLLEEAKGQLGEQGFDMRLKAMGLTKDQLMDKWLDGEIAKIVLTRELKINITDDDIKKFYNDNPSQFEDPEMVRASHILLSTRDQATNTELSDAQKAAKHKLAEDLLKRARAGEDFAKLASQYSEDPGSKDKGGEYKFPRGQMVKEFEDAAFALKPGQVSDIVTTQFGYHIIKLSEKIPAKKHDLAESSSKIRDYLVQTALQKQGPPYLEQLRKQADVQILDEKLKAAEETAAADSLQPAAGAANGHSTAKP
ncbi:MAG TPA: peptidylprolyl isomerase [Verrucomicrobiae bacterium]|nr:peptidylprolyl isomerase [Verrucomicrobiae bacterium]